MIIAKVGLFRWKMIFICYCALLCCIIGFFAPPAAKWLIKEVYSIREGINASKMAEVLPNKIKAVNAETHYLEKLVIEASTTEIFEESLVLARLYALCDSAGFTANKILIGDKILADKVSEIPVTISGFGKYDAFGKLIAGIETLVFPTRTRFVSIQNKKEGIGDVEIEFTALENIIAIH